MVGFILKRTRRSTHEPPFTERKVYKGVLGAVGIGLVEAPHGLGEYAWQNVSTNVNRSFEDNDELAWADTRLARATMAPETRMVPETMSLNLSCTMGHGSVVNPLRNKRKWIVKERIERHQK